MGLKEAVDGVGGLGERGVLPPLHLALRPLLDVLRRRRLGGRGLRLLALDGYIVRAIVVDLCLPLDRRPGRRGSRRGDVDRRPRIVRESRVGRAIEVAVHPHVGGIELRVGGLRLRGKLGKRGTLHKHVVERAVLRLVDSLDGIRHALRRFWQRHHRVRVPHIEGLDSLRAGAGRRPGPLVGKPVLHEVLDESVRTVRPLLPVDDRLVVPSPLRDRGAVPSGQDLPVEHDSSVRSHVKQHVDCIDQMGGGTPLREAADAKGHHLSLAGRRILSVASGQNLHPPLIRLRDGVDPVLGSLPGRAVCQCRHGLDALS